MIVRIVFCAICYVNYNATQTGLVLRRRMITFARNPLSHFFAQARFALSVLPRTPSADHGSPGSIRPPSDSLA